MSKVLKWIVAIASAAIIVYGVVVLIREMFDNTKTFTECVVEDYDYAMSFKKDSSVVCFYEIQAVMNDLADESYDDELEVVSYRAVFQTFGPNVAHFRDRDILGKEVVDSEVEDLWLGSNDINPTTLPVDFNKAVKLLFKASEKDSIVIPSSDKVTLRSPVGPEPLNAMWIFGSTNSAKKGQAYVSVDAVTGEVGYIR